MNSWPIGPWCLSIDLIIIISLNFKVEVYGRFCLRIFIYFICSFLSVYFCSSICAFNHETCVRAVGKLVKSQYEYNNMRVLVIGWIIRTILVWLVEVLLFQADQWPHLVVLIFSCGFCLYILSCGPMNFKCVMFCKGFLTPPLYSFNLVWFLHIFNKFFCNRQTDAKCGLVKELSLHPRIPGTCCDLCILKTI